MSQAPAPIVVVDAAADTVEFLCDYLHAVGFAAAPCAIGPQLAACIIQHAPRLVILDVDLGDLTGIDVFHALRADARTRSVPVIFFTGNPDKLRHELPDYHTRAAALASKPDSGGLPDLIHALTQQQA